MGFLDSIRKVLRGSPRHQDEERRKLARAWDLDESVLESPVDESGRIEGATAYDQRMWSKKLRHLVIDANPIAVDEWRDFMADATALGFDPDWVGRERYEAFMALLRKSVADGIITGDEHELIDLWRLRLGLSEEEAEEALGRIVAEARALLGRDVTII